MRRGVTTELPAGEVTFLFTDVEGSTALLRRLGDERYEQVLALHDRILRDTWAAHDGFELGTEGDSFFVAFHDAHTALRAAAAAQRAIDDAAWPDDVDLRVRIGVHTGLAHPVDGNYRALAVHQAARVTATARGGQIFTTSETLASCPRHPAEYVTSDRGRYRVRDFDGPIHLHLVTPAGRVAVRTPPRVRPADRTNTIAPLTPLIGRDRELATLHEQLGPGRLVTVVGPGGVGKTRLATEVALTTEWPDGAWLVDLSAVRSGDDVPAATAEAVGIAPAPADEPWGAVLASLGEMQTLLVLDNCEQLDATFAAMVVDLQRECPGVSILATSRAPLGVRSETVVRLSGLAAAHPSDPAAQLLLQRVGARGTTFAPGAVVELCTELDGLPVALEVAAGQLQVLDPSELVRQLRSGLTTLKSGDPTIPERHRSLDRLYEWSESLLDDDPRRLLADLCVVAGTFDLDMAASIADWEGQPVAPGGSRRGPGDRARTVGALIDLVHASLVELDEAGGATRYRILATVRNHLLARRDPDELATSVRRYAAALLDRVGPARPLDRHWAGVVALELENVRSTMARLADLAARDDVVTAQALCWTVGYYHDRTDSFRAGIAELERWIDVLAAETPEVVAVLSVLADLHLRVGDVDRAAAVLDRAESISGRVGVPAWDAVGALRSRGEIDLRTGNPQRAADRARAALTGDLPPRHRARLLNQLGIARYELGDLRGAVEAFEDEIHASELAGMESFLVNAHGNLAEALLQLGDDQGAAVHQLQCLELRPARNDDVHQAFFLMVAAQLAARERDWSGAAELQGAADRLVESVGFVLYDQDAQRREQLLASAHAELGSTRFADATTAGRTLDATVAADRAVHLMRRVAANAPGGGP